MSPQSRSYIGIEFVAALSQTQTRQIQCDLPQQHVLNKHAHLQLCHRSDVGHQHTTLFESHLARVDVECVTLRVQ